MVFTVLAACDLNGKVNFELTFQSLPTVSELRARIDEVMSAEASLRRPPQAGPFRIHRAQVFDERMEMWVDLVASGQLEDYCQVYIFQKETPWHKDTPGRIPPPTKPADGQFYARSSSPPTYGDYSAPQLPYREGSGSPYQGNGSVYAAGSPGRFDDNSPRHAGYGSPTGTGASPYGSGSPYGSHGVNSGDNAAEPSKSEMVRAVYEELDQRKSRSVTLNEWSDCFSRLRIAGDSGEEALTNATVIDLFQKKADRNEDGVVSFPEFQTFADNYPKLTESMFFRSRKLGQENQRKNRINQKYDQLNEAERKLDDARQQALEAESEGLNAKQRGDDIDREIQQSKEDERLAEDDKRNSHQDTEQARNRVRDAKAQEQQARENLKKQEAQKRNAQRTVENAEKKAQAQHNERERIQRELEALKRRVEEKERELLRQEEQIDVAQRDADEARLRAQDAEDPQLDDDMQRAQDSVRLAEDDLKQYVAAENEKAAAHRNAQRQTAQLTQQKQQMEKDQQGQRQKEQQRKSAEQRAEKAVEDIRRDLERMEDRDAQEDAKRAEQEQRENEILSMEVRLREQREAVERKEEHLRTEHRAFTQDTGRSSPTRAYES